MFGKILKVVFSAGKNLVMGTVNNIKDTIHYINVLVGNMEGPLALKIIFATAFYAAAISASVGISIAYPFIGDDASVISSIGCTINSVGSPPSVACCSEACLRMGADACSNFSRSSCSNTYTINTNNANTSSSSQNSTSSSQVPPESSSQTSAINSYDRCDTFDDFNIDVSIYESRDCERIVGTTINFNDEIPGIENDGDGDSYRYFLEIGDRNGSCSWEGWEFRLSCTVKVPASYLNTYQKLRLFVNGCKNSNETIYYEARASVPSFSACGDSASPTNNCGPDQKLNAQGNCVNSNRGEDEDGSSSSCPSHQKIPGGGCCNSPGYSMQTKNGQYACWPD